KRKGQYYVQTWHSSLRLKQIEQDAENNLPPQYLNMAKKDSNKCDLLLSGCQFSTAIFKRAFWYDREIFEKGTPRNDVLFKNDNKKREEVMQRLKISPHSKVLLYAPTFRENNQVDIYNLNFSRI